MTKVKTIFEIIDRTLEREENIFFEDYMYGGEWIKSPQSGDNFDTVLLISSDTLYKYYLALNANNTIMDTLIFRARR